MVEVEDDAGDIATGRTVVGGILADLAGVFAQLALVGLRVAVVAGRRTVAGNACAGEGLFEVYDRVGRVGGIVRAAVAAV